MTRGPKNWKTRWLSNRFKTVLFIAFGLMFFCIFGPSVIFSVISGFLFIRSSGLGLPYQLGGKFPNQRLSTLINFTLRKNFKFNLIQFKINKGSNFNLLNVTYFGLKYSVALSASEFKQQMTANWVFLQHTKIKGF